MCGNVYDDHVAHKGSASLMISLIHWSLIEIVNLIVMWLSTSLTTESKRPIKSGGKLHKQLEEEQRRLHHRIRQNEEVIQQKNATIEQKDFTIQQKNSEIVDLRSPWDNWEWGIWGGNGSHL